MRAPRLFEHTLAVDDARKAARHNAEQACDARKQKHGSDRELDRVGNSR